MGSVGGHKALPTVGCAAKLPLCIDLVCGIHHVVASIGDRCEMSLPSLQTGTVKLMIGGHRLSSSGGDFYNTLSIRFSRPVRLRDDTGVCRVL